MLNYLYVWLFQPLNYGLKQTVKHLVEMTILILGYFYPKTWVVWITGKITQKFGLFLPTGFYSAMLYSKNFTICIQLVTDCLEAENQCGLYKKLFLPLGYYVESNTTLCFTSGCFRTIVSCSRFLCYLLIFAFMSLL